MKKLNTVSLAVGATFAVTALSPVAFAADNPFAMKKLDSGYQLLADAHGADKKKDGKCGEGKCGAGKAAKAKEGKCGGDNKAKEGSCGGDKAKEGSCGGDKAKEGSCGGDKAK